MTVKKIRNKKLLVKVNFQLSSLEETAGKIHYFRTDIKTLLPGHNVIVNSRGKEMIATVIGYAEPKEYNATSDVVRRLRTSEGIDHRDNIQALLVDNPLQITDEAFEQYRTKFRGNLNSTIPLACAKLTRNILLSNKRYIHADGAYTFQYGNQKITVKNNIITELRSSNTSRKFVKDLEHYKILNVLLEIDEMEWEIKNASTLSQAK